jgi:hypothetical protein
VVIDGTATGVFGALPSFQREDILIPSLRSQHSASQYLLVKEPEREAVRFLCRMSLKVQPGPGYDNYLGDVEISLNNLAASGSKMVTKSARLLALQILVRSCTEAEVNELLAPLREVVLSSTTPESLSLKFSVPVSNARCLGLRSIFTIQPGTKAQTWRRQKYLQAHYGRIFIFCC